MDGKRTVWSVSAGEYSDYRVLDLFEDKADAEANAARNPDWRAQEFTLHPPGSGNVFQQVIEWSATAWVSKEGRILDDISTYSWHEWPEDARPADYATASVHETIKYQSSTAPPVEVYEVYAFTDSEERARKAVQERAAKVASILIDGGDPTGES